MRMALSSDVRLRFDVKPTAFYPPPRVDSAVVSLEPHRRNLGVADPDAFLHFVGHCFRHKRKTIRNNLVEVYGNEILASWPEARLRAEQISLEKFVSMFHRVVLG